MFKELNFNIDIVFGICIAVIVILLYVRIKNGGYIKKKSSLSMPGYVLVYTDQSADKKEKNVEYSKILYSEKYDIQGKPDYIFKKAIGRSFVPLEVKSGTIGSDERPHKGDLLQLASYFIIIEDVYGVKPRYGKLVYRDYMFKVRNTRRIRKEVIKTVNSMRNMMKTRKGEANASFVNCRYCLCRGTVCKYCKKE